MWTDGSAGGFAVGFFFKNGGACKGKAGSGPMSDEGSCVTLIFYRINPQWWKEPALNLASALAQMSNLTHCEISLGEESPANSNAWTDP